MRTHGAFSVLAAAVLYLVLSYVILCLTWALLRWNALDL